RRRSSEAQGYDQPVRTTATRRHGTVADGGDDPAGKLPTVTVGIPVLNEEIHLATCLDGVIGQSYPNIVEVLVADGGSTDLTRAIAENYPDNRVTLLDNPRRRRPAGLNVAIAAATGEIFVRVDARTRLAPDYVERCVTALERTGAAIVGGPMRFTSTTAAERGVQAAMTSRLGAGPAQFRRETDHGAFVDTVYLGAYRLDTIRQLGGYDEWFGGNEDAELAWRAQAAGGVYLDPDIRSTYAVREGLGPGAPVGGAGSRRRHPQSLEAARCSVLRRRRHRPGTARCRAGRPGSRRRARSVVADDARGVGGGFLRGDDAAQCSDVARPVGQ
ncbi:MAG: glycosyltransferase family 2 protein, partial [Acidimicrobiales bacterium]